MISKKKKKKSLWAFVLQIVLQLKCRYTLIKWYAIDSVFAFRPPEEPIYANTPNKQPSPRPSMSAAAVSLKAASSFQDPRTPSPASRYDEGKRRYKHWTSHGSHKLMPAKVLTANFTGTLKETFPFHYCRIYILFIWITGLGFFHSNCTFFKMRRWSSFYEPLDGRWWMRFECVNSWFCSLNFCIVLLNIEYDEYWIFGNVSNSFWMEYGEDLYTHMYIFVLFF